jgi:membrane-associated protease RseP (regulator of RpoE activity)
MFRGFNVKNAPLMLTIAALLATGGSAMASAADGRAGGAGTVVSTESGYTIASTSGGNTSTGTTTGTSTSGSSPGNNTATGASITTSTDPTTADLDAQLADARAKLEEAAHEVAEISARMSKPLVDNMLFTTDGPSRAVIGVQLDTNSGKEGARIQEVSPGGPADEAGLRVGDLIVAVNGADVKGENPARQVLHQMRKVEPDSKVKLTIIRDGKPREVAVTARPGAAFFVRMHEPHGIQVPLPPNPPGDPFFQEFSVMPPMMIHGPLGEMELATLSPQLGRYFGTDKGVLVVRAPKEEGFKLEDGDVILAIDGREPTSGSHATRILRSYQPGEKISIKLMRQHKTVSIETTLPERRLTGPGPVSDGKVRVSHAEPDSTT